MICIVPKPELTVQQIARLRKMCSLGLAEIRHAANVQTPVREINIFGSQWQSERLFLRELALEYSSDMNVPFIVRETNEYGLNEVLSPESLRHRLEFWRGIELEQQMLSDLENGFISSPEEFVPHDEEWA